jgi:hypothetical protein
VKTSNLTWCKDSLPVELKLNAGRGLRTNRKDIHVQERKRKNQELQMQELRLVELMCAEMASVG